MKRLFRPSALAFLFAGALQACSLAEVPREPPPSIDLPSSYSLGGPGSERHPRWWDDFGDPELSKAIAVALEENASIGQALARLRQAEAAARRAGSAQFPEVTASGEYSRSRSSLDMGEDLGARTVTSSLYGVSLAAGYEVDLWGRVGALERAARAEATATREDVDSAAMTLAARIAETWFDIAEGNAQLDLLRRQAEVGRDFLRLVEMRFSLGQTGVVDVLWQREQLAATESQLPVAEARLAVLGNLLALLQGRPAGRPPAAGLPHSLPALPPAPEAGIPADLLQQRPDIRAALARIRAADHQAGAAMAERYPALRLSLRSGFQWREVAKVFDNWVYQFAATLLQPVFDGGRRDAEVERRNAIVAERIEVWRRAVLDALREVEDALVREARQAEYLREIERRLLLARSTVERSRFRYGQGQSGYLPVLASLLELQKIEREELAARREALSYRVQLYRALGGGWAPIPEPPPGDNRSQADGDHP